MYATNFEYDNQCLSDYGFIVCDFDYSDGAVTADTGSKITFSKVSRNSGKTYSLTGTQYEDCVTASFDICKNPEIYDNYEDREISNNEYRNLMRWLNRRGFFKFKVFDFYSYERESCYYNASFNIEKIKIAEKLYGLRLTMESSEPFGYGSERLFQLNFSSNSLSRTLMDTSDEIGCTYPDMIITCKQSGDLTISNESVNCTMTIKNCSNNEAITINGKERIITSSLTSHDICNDFNYEFFKIGNTINNRKNIITVSAPCSITIKYFPIIKDQP